MRIALATDHAGFPLKDMIAEELRTAGHEVVDLGTDGPGNPVDYPDVAEAACRALLDGEAERAVLLCGSGVGVTIAANKFAGIRAGSCHDTYSARQGVEHDDMNVLGIGARVVGPELARDILRAFMGATFNGADRFVRRLKKIEDIERRVAQSKSESST